MRDQRPLTIQLALQPHLDGGCLLSARCPANLAEASLTRAAADALRDRGQYRVHAVHQQPYHTKVVTVPATLETHGHLVAPILRFLSALSDIATARSLAITRNLLSRVPPGKSVSPQGRDRISFATLVCCCAPTPLSGRWYQS
jgi:hypothetical protein